MESLNMQLQPFFDWLLRTTVQASLLICLILLLQVVLRGKLGPRWCHALWLLLLIRMAMPWAPQSRASIFNLIPRSIPQRQTEYAQDEIAEDAFKSDVADKGTIESTTSVTEDTPKAATVTPEIRKKVPSQLKPAFFKVSNVLPLVWLAGVLALGVYICAANFALLRIVRRERPLTEQKILDLLEDCKAEMGIRTILGLVITDKVKSPALFGFVRPRLLLPKGILEALGGEELRYVFLHELAHLKRRDIYLGWLTSILQALHWFNPLVWLAFYRMHADRELACDALVLACTQASESEDYGRTVVSLLERFSRPRRLPAMAGILETKAQLKRRITMIARFKKNSYQWSALAIVLIIMLGCVSLLDARRTKAADTTKSKPVPQIVLRRVNHEPGDRASISPDGKYLCDVDWDTGNLVVRELATGKVRPLTSKGSWEDSRDMAGESAISPNSKTVAFKWLVEMKGDELHIVGLDGSEHRLLRPGDLFPVDWSPDGKQILATIRRKDAQDIVWVSAVDSSVEGITTVKNGWSEKTDLSPDGRYIAYDIPQEKGSSKRDIFVFAVDERREIPLVQHPADDKLLGWTPDGKHILFVSDRMGTANAWLLQVADGKPHGLPELVKPLIGDVKPIGFTQSGSYYYTASYKAEDVYVASLDLETGKVLSSPRPIRQSGSESCPDWSPDGRCLAYCSQRHPNESQVIHIRSMVTGQERDFDLNFPRFLCLRWSPDGRSLLASRFNRKAPQVVYKVDVETGKHTALLRSQLKNISEAELSPDGKALFYRESGSLLVRDLETGHEKELFRSPPMIWWWALSPDGQHLALNIRENKPNRCFVLKVMSSAGGNTRELLRKNLDEHISDVVWTPDSQNVLCETFTKQGPKLWRIPAEGGEPRELWQWEKGIGLQHLRVHPDGRRIAFVGTHAAFELWEMSNFLPAAGE
jgi:beta-lactamase regulating signal transducer with metallopeptidase domain/Tol biopolymer transport system component